MNKNLQKARRCAIPVAFLRVFTNKNCQAGDIELVEYGHPKIDCGNHIMI